MRVLDIAAANGASGEALSAAGLHLVLGTQIVESARGAALRDRPLRWTAWSGDCAALSAGQAQ
jgi:hypothetical protein